MRLFIVGDYAWQNPFAKALIQQVAEAGFDDRSVFSGFVEAIGAFLSVSDVHVCPSVFEEPLGNTVLEAKAAGLPSIVFPSGGLPELVRHGYNGWICSSKTEEALVAAMGAYVQFRERAKVEGEAARASLAEFGA